MQEAQEVEVEEEEEVASPRIPQSKARLQHSTHPGQPPTTLGLARSTPVLYVGIAHLGSITASIHVKGAKDSSSAQSEKICPITAGRRKTALWTSVREIDVNPADIKNA